MKRALLFLACLGVGALLLVWRAGGLEGPRSGMSEPEVGTAPTPPGGTGAPMTPAGPGMPPLRVKDLGETFYPRPEARVFRDAATGETVEIPHFVPWTFQARSGIPLQGKEAPEGAIVFEDVIVRAYRGPATTEEARRLRDDPRAIDGLTRLVLFARRARANGIATLLRARGGPMPEVRDWTIRLDGDVRIHDLDEHVEMRGPSLVFDPEAGRAEGDGPFVLEHAAWTIEGEHLTLVRDPRLRDLYRMDVYRVDIGRNVLVEIREPPTREDSRATTDGGPGSFRPARVFADRASLLRDETGGQRVHVALEGNVRALQRGGRRLLADRLRLTAAPGTAGGAGAERSWAISDLEAEGAPAVVEVEDLPGKRGETAEGRFTARRIRYERSSDNEQTTVLEGDPVVLIEGDLALPGLPGRGGWIRASARDRAVFAPTVAGKHLLLSGAARLERRGESGTPFHDVLEGDEISLTLKAGASPDQLQPVAFAALGHVRLSGTRLDGEAERLVVEGLDTLEPSIVISGADTRMAFLGLDGGQRMLGQDPPPGDAAAAPADARAGAAEPTWLVDRLEASGGVAGETRLGGPVLGVPAWLEAERVLHERLTGKTTLTGAGSAPASIRVEASGDQRHSLTAPTITFERARGTVRAEGGAQGEVVLTDAGPDALPAGLGGPGAEARRASRLTLITDGRIEFRFRLARVGGDPAPGAPQILRVLSPFTAEVRPAHPDLVDRLRADRLDVSFVVQPKEPHSSKTASVARAANPGPATAAARPGRDTGRDTGRKTTAERWKISARTLAFDLQAGRVDTFEADGGVTVDGKTLHVEGGSLRYDNPLRSLFLQGAPRARARFGERSESIVEATTLRVMLDDEGPRQVLASGPVQAVLVQAGPKQLGHAERFEVDSKGDVRITRTELTTLGNAETWLRRMERSTPTAAWGSPAEIWSRHILVRGTGLLERMEDPLAAGSASARRIDTVTAEGPDTAFVSGSAASRIEMWCQRIVVDVAEGTATLEGAPGRDVRLRRDGLESELLGASFDFRTGAVRNVEAGEFILRPGR